MKLEDVKVLTQQALAQSMGKDYMAQNNLTVEQMSKLCDMSPRTFSSVINNRRLVDAKLMLKLSLALHLPINQILIEK